MRSIPLPAGVNLLQVSPDSRYLAASLSSSQTALFDFASGRELAVLPGSAHVYNGIQIMGSQFSPDSRYILITIPGDHTAYGFLMDNNALVKLACQRLAAITLPGADGVVPRASDLQEELIYVERFLGVDAQNLST